MWSVGLIKIKVDKNIFIKEYFNNPQFYDVFENGYLKIGTLIIADKKISYGSVSEEPDWRAEPYLVSMGLPYPSSYGEVAKMSIPCYFIRNLSRSAADMVTDFKYLNKCFDINSFVVEGDQLCKKIANYLFDYKTIIHLLFICSFAFKAILTKEYLIKNRISSNIGHIAQCITKFIPANIDIEKIIDKEVIIQRTVYGADDSYPRIFFVGVVPMKLEHYSKNNLKLLAATKKHSLIIVMSRGQCNLFQFYEYVFLQNPITFRRDCDVIVYNVFMGLMMVNKYDIHHGDFHCANVVFKESEGKMFDQRFQNITITGISYHIDPIDFGRSYFFNDKTSAELCLEIYLDNPDIRLTAHNDNWCKGIRGKMSEIISHPDFMINIGLIDIATMLQSIEQCYDYYKENGIRDLNPSHIENDFEIKKYDDIIWNPLYSDLREKQRWVFDKIEDWINYGIVGGEEFTVEEMEKYLSPLNNIVSKQRAEIEPLSSNKFLLQFYSKFLRKETFEKI